MRELQHYKERYSDPQDPYKSFWASGIYALMHSDDPVSASMWYRGNRENVLKNNVLVNAYRPRYKLRCERVDGQYVLKSLPDDKKHKEFKQQNPNTLFFLEEVAGSGKWVPLPNIPYHTSERRMAHIFAFFCYEFGHRATCYTINKNRITYIQIYL